MQRLIPLLMPLAIIVSAVLLAIALRPPRYQYAVFQNDLVLRGDTRSGEAILCRPSREGDGVYLSCWTTLDRYRSLLRSNR